MTNKYEKKIGKFGEVYSVPRPTEVELDAFYKEEYYSEGVNSTYQLKYTDDELAQKKIRANITIRSIMEKLGDLCTNPKMLEIGCGEGFVISAGRKMGLSIKGVDFQSEPVEKFNPHIVDHFIQFDPKEFLRNEIKDGCKYDALILQNVLEHVIDPGALLLQLKQMLSSNGVLLVQVPNDYSKFQEYAKSRGKLKHETWFRPPEHLNYWNSENIRPYVESLGYKIIDQFSDFPIEMYYWGNETNYNLDPTRLGPHAHIGRVELDLYFAQAGEEAYLGLYRAFSRVSMGRNLILLLQDQNSR